MPGLSLPPENFSFIRDIISKESRNLSFSEAINFVQASSAQCKNVSGDVSVNFAKKLVINATK